ncbi:hypothetical protein C0993_007925 [Termitomyces sp. T159_Od127]|nr:hypothetical protein C0993_007925 [Termitomyces sp. T159_Od127]
MKTSCQANLLGSSVGLMVAYHLERHYRYRREVPSLHPPTIFSTIHVYRQISRLYRPLETDLSDLSDPEDETGTQLLPMYNRKADRAPQGSQYKSTRLADVWDEREDVFDMEGVSDDEDDAIPGPASSIRDASQSLIPKTTSNGI